MKIYHFELALSGQKIEGKVTDSGVIFRAETHNVPLNKLPRPVAAVLAKVEAGATVEKIMKTEGLRARDG